MLWRGVWTQSIVPYVVKLYKCNRVLSAAALVRYRGHCCGAMYVALVAAQVKSFGVRTGASISGCCNHPVRALNALCARERVVFLAPSVGSDRVPDARVQGGFRSCGDPECSG